MPFTLGTAAASTGPAAVSPAFPGTPGSPATGSPEQGDSADRQPHEGGRGLPRTPIMSFGAFLGSDEEAFRRADGMRAWLRGTRQRVGHTYLPGDRWSNIEGLPRFLSPWARWRAGGEDRLFVLNVPMLPGNEEPHTDAGVRRLLAEGAAGRYDHRFRTLAQRLVRLGLHDAVLVPGWEMNGTTYTHRCGPDPHAWKTYWRSLVTAMRSVPGQEFRFDFAPSRGEDALAWPLCYPGDDVVDIIGMDTYDQPPGEDFDDYITQPYGLRAHVDFAAAHGKPISFPEWGLFRNGDNAAYMRRMLEWMTEHPPVYQTISDYCPHGVWWCDRNPESARVFREAFAAR